MAIGQFMPLSVAELFDPPGSVTYNSGTHSFVVPAYKTFLRIRMWGGGGGGAHVPPVGTPQSGTSGGATKCSSLGLTANVGGGGSGGTAPGGTASGGDTNTTGGSSSGLKGGASPNGGSGGDQLQPGKSPGGGGGGDRRYNSNIGQYITGSGGGGGGYLQKQYSRGAIPAGSVLSFSVGSGGAGASSNNGANGRVIIEWE